MANSCASFYDYASDLYDVRHLQNCPLKQPPTSKPDILKESKHHTKQMRVDVICPAAPWENTTTDADRAYDLAYDLSEEYQCDVDLRYNESGIIFTTVSNY